MCRQRTPAFLLLPALAIPVAIHFTLLFLYAVNAPRLDDFSEILTFLPDWHAASTLQEQLTVFFRDYQNHRYVLYHALLLLCGGIDFRTATLLGNLALPALCALMMIATRHHPQRYLIWLATPLLVFNLQNWRAMFWGPLGTTNLLYPMLGLLACWLATRGPRGVLAAGCTAVLLTLSHGSGPLLFPVIAVYLWLQRNQQHRDQEHRDQEHRSLIGWLVLSAIVLALYFFVFPLRSDAGYSSVSTTALLQNFFLHTLAILQGFFALLGSHLLYNDANLPWRQALAITVGIGECLWLGFLIRHGALKRYPALCMWLGFLLLVAVSIASGRVALAGIDQALQGHYKLLSSLMLWFLLVATLQWTDKGRLFCIALPVALYCAALALFLSPMREFQQSLADDVQQWKLSGKLQHIETRLYVLQHNRKLKAAIDGGFYNPFPDLSADHQD